MRVAAGTGNCLAEPSQAGTRKMPGKQANELYSKEKQSARQLCIKENDYNREAREMAETGETVKWLQQRKWTPGPMGHASAPMGPWARGPLGP